MATAVLPADTNVRSEQPVASPPRKLNLFRRLRGKNKKKEEQKDPDVTLDAQEEAEVDGLATKEATTTTAVAQPPPASQAAYGGPPRYDWIDIVRSRG